MQRYNKAIAGFVTPAILGLLSFFGVTPDMPVSEAVEVLVMATITAMAVYFIPNRG